jgi:hypothetical protein
LSFFTLALLVIMFSMIFSNSTRSAFVMCFNGFIINVFSSDDWVELSYSFIETADIQHSIATDNGEMMHTFKSLYVIPGNCLSVKRAVELDDERYVHAAFSSGVYLQPVLTEPEITEAEIGGTYLGHCKDCIMWKMLHSDTFDETTSSVLTSYGRISSRNINNLAFT